MPAGPALEVISFSRTAPGATIAAAAAFAGDSANVKNFSKPAQAWLLGAWADVQAVGTVQIRSSKLHDNQRGIRLDTTVSDVKPLLPHMFKQPLYATDTLVVELSGSAAAGDVEQVSLLLYYENVDGAGARLIDTETLRKRMVGLVGVENTITTTAGPAYSGAEAINAESDLLIAGQDYAILGYLVDTECQSVVWRGADLGNVRAGGPGDELGRDFTRGWFYNLAMYHNLPLIPVFNAQNKGNLFIEVAQDENAAAVTVITLLGQLQ